MQQPKLLVEAILGVCKLEGNLALLKSPSRGVVGARTELVALADVENVSCFSKKRVPVCVSNVDDGPKGGYAKGNCEEEHDLVVVVNEACEHK